MGKLEYLDALKRAMLGLPPDVQARTLAKQASKAGSTKAGSTGAGAVKPDAGKRGGRK